MGRFEIFSYSQNIMCGIFGCIAEEAADKVLEGLSKLEYRGYDSAGVAALFSGHRGPVKTERTTGYVADLVSKANNRFTGSMIAIGHTRWATHGRVTETNAHPHSSSDGAITMVHNGIIENANELLEDVEKLGYEVKSETDSEVIVHLLDHELKTGPQNSSILDAFDRTIKKLRGSWAIAVIMTGLDGILIARNGAPLIVGRGHKCICISSDVQPFQSLCSEVSYLSDGDVFLLRAGEIHSLPESHTPHFQPIEGEFHDAESGIYPHLMLKEIHDQPVSLSNVLGGRISPGGSRASLDLDLTREQILNLDRINFVACGTAFHAAQLGVHYIREHTDLTCEAFRASEFPADRVCRENTLTIGISQSGETKDTLDALQMAKKSGSHISSFCNVIGSTIARFAGNGVYLHAGPEYSVASTKVFTNMVAAVVMFALMISNKPASERRKMVQEMRKLPQKISTQLLELDEHIDGALSQLDGGKKPIFIGRGVSAIMAEEGALKMMEETYIPCISFPAGELKHGPIALVEEGTPVIAIAPTDKHLSSMESSIRECKSRGATIIMISDKEGEISHLADFFIPLEKADFDLSPFCTAVPLQLLAYKLAVKLGLNVDRPRNLAKSVTVS